MRPMLATRGSTVPTGPEWLHEVKWDGMRVLIEVSQGRLKVFSRNENDVTVSFPELNGLAEQMRGLENRVLPDSLVLGRELYELEPLVFQCQDALGGGG